jgi:uncharacterized SAM-binding protein YcdF (DUF218 family)
MWLAIARVLGRPFAIEKRALERRDAIVVLGAVLRRDRLSAILRERVAVAAMLFAAGAGSRIITTGGVTGESTRSEAEALAEGLVAAGVPREVITVEDRAQTTDENARFTAEILGRARVWIVTQPFHARRAEYLFQRAGLDAWAWHVADSLEYREPRRAVRWYVREYAAWLKVAVTARRGRDAC